ncbi:hypothetical protein VP1G_11429 [Cytospora mali]|uniref:Uncharacterized protein n=1 Tax=Cytospora mali TaxID=578113 RepID=A0A194VG76_CYTMA|nr:hypothetical protein VP1G_11429 [Valsa mali var. pyri (nom. inval.)]
MPLISSSGSATTGAGRNAQMGSIQRNTFDFDNVIARAACADEAVGQSVRRRQANASSQIQRVDASLSSQGFQITSVRSFENDELCGVGAQFDA